MNTSQPQDSLRKKLKKLKKTEESWKRTKQERGLYCCASPLPAPGKLGIRPPQTKNCSAVPAPTPELAL